MRKRLHDHIGILIAIALLTSGCGVVTYAKSLFVSGVSLEALGEQFVQVTTQVTSSCDAKAIPASVCLKYREFGLNFQKTYPLTVGLWKAADRAGDKASKQKAEDVAAGLAADLSSLAIEALGTFATGGK